MDSKTWGRVLAAGWPSRAIIPGKARTPDELRADLDKAFSLIPGKHRLNLHSFYRRIQAANEWIATNSKRSILQTGSLGLVDTGIGLDFNPDILLTSQSRGWFYFVHRDKGIRQFWIEHGIACREIGAAMGKALGKTCITNVWIPDGYKDSPADRKRSARKTR